VAGDSIAATNSTPPDFSKKGSVLEVLSEMLKHQKATLEENLEHLRSKEVRTDVEMFHSTQGLIKMTRRTISRLEHDVSMIKDCVDSDTTHTSGMLFICACFMQSVSRVPVTCVLRVPVLLHGFQTLFRHFRP
jgi:hypothetical protein